MENKIQETKDFLEKYDSSKYEKPSVTVDIPVFKVDDGGNAKVLQLLLIRRKNHPYKDCFALPGGFIEMKESLEESAFRELMEETNMTVTHMEQLCTMGAVNRDPRMRIISVVYLAFARAENSEAIAGDDAAEAIWFNIYKEAGEKEKLVFENIEKNIKFSYVMCPNEKKGVFVNFPEFIKEDTISCAEGLAFDHATIIYMALKHIKEKILYTQEAFKIMPDEFTLTELQEIYESIIGKSLYKANFRKKVLPLVQKTDNKKTKVAHRPVQYYAYQNNNK
jgi:ADP-ribose pyrophosphatase